ncbi:hypothetical protein J6590_044783 [Homalodisca vitripennis]|nr:hypothetical protein J6590_044783 [Homalodisca vitripennis]
MGQYVDRDRHNNHPCHTQPPPQTSAMLAAHDYLVTGIMREQAAATAMSRADHGTDEVCIVVTVPTAVSITFMAPPVNLELL